MRFRSWLEHSGSEALQRVLCLMKSKGVGNNFTARFFANSRRASRVHQELLPRWNSDSLFANRHARLNAVELPSNEHGGGSKNGGQHVRRVWQRVVVKRRTRKGEI